MLTKEIDEKTKNEFEKIITEELKEKLVFEELEKVDLNDIEIKPKKKFGFSFLIFAICIALGLIFDNVGMGILWGLILSITSGIAIAQKKNNKKQINNYYINFLK